MKLKWNPKRLHQITSSVAVLGWFNKNGENATLSYNNFIADYWELKYKKCIIDCKLYNVRQVNKKYFVHRPIILHEDLIDWKHRHLNDSNLELIVFGEILFRLLFATYCFGREVKEPRP